MENYIYIWKKIISAIWGIIKYPLLGLIVYLLVVNWMSAAALEKKHPEGFCKDIDSSSKVNHINYNTYTMFQRIQYPCIDAYYNDVNNYKADVITYYNNFDMVKNCATYLLLWAAIGFVIDYWLGYYDKLIARFKK